MDKQSIMIVDEKPNNIRSLETILKPEGYRTLGVSCGSNALMTAARQPPDLFLIDAVLPDMDGYYVAEKIKLSPKTKHIPIIIMSDLSNRKSRLV